MQIHIITAFPQMFDSPFKESIVKRAIEKGKVEVLIYDLRKWSEDRHKTIDDKPYGGGAGMILKIEPLYKAVREIRSSLAGQTVKVVLTSAKGTQYCQSLAKEFSNLDAIIIICGHYEGVDERVAKYLCDFELAIGKFILTGGEIPAMLIADSIIRLIPGVLGNDSSTETESFSHDNNLEAPHYTRPSEFHTDDGEVWSVPTTLISGNHKEIDDWRASNSGILPPD